MDTKLQLRLNGYGVNPAGHIFVSREPDYRYAHERLGVFVITAPKDFAAKIVTALDEPAALVGVSSYLTVALFRFKSHIRARLEFIVAGRQGFILVNDGAAPVDVGAYSWAAGRSPLTVSYSQLPPLFEDHVESMTRAVTEFGATLGSLPTPEEIERQKAFEDRVAHTKILTEAELAEVFQAREDERIVKENEGREITTSGFPEPGGNRVLLARYRHAERKKRAAEAAIATTAT